MKRKTAESIEYMFILLITLCTSCSFFAKSGKKMAEETKRPRIVNIINFVRFMEPREPNGGKEVLYQTVVKQIETMKKYHLRGTFLIQYDALIDSRYQQLFKSLPDSMFEIGAWWEIPQPLVERAGLEWRGRYPWDWHANVGFSIGYSPNEREKLVDNYMKDFKQVFGYYPKSVGCWFIDAHTLKYMYDKYNIVASCNCRDQIGTDGYTLWGGYWNQGYYPSIKNSYMPAQNEQNQIPVPVFRMLGSDPVRQYDSGLGTNKQGVITLEPSYAHSGADSAWVNWYFKEFIEGECMEYAYIQTGQENSFTWKEMSKGFETQLSLIAQLKKEKKITVATLSQAGQWFRERYKTTPATAVTVKEDLPGSNFKTVWFNSRYYRANLLWENNALRIRDIHLFDENLESPYLSQKTTSESCAYYTLPFVDGFRWSSADQTAGLKLKAVVDGKEILPEGENIQVDDSSPGKLHVSWTLGSVRNSFIINMDEKQLAIKTEGSESLTWYLELIAAKDAPLPFKKIDKKRIDCSFLGMNYSISLAKGMFIKSENNLGFKIEPEQNELRLNFVVN